MFLSSSLRVVKYVTCAEGDHGQGHWYRRLDQVGQAPLTGQKPSMLNLSPQEENAPMLSSCFVH